jgi:nitrate reductase NapD
MTEPVRSDSDEVHVAGLVVHALPDAAERVAAAIGRRSGACVHARSPEGKLVVTLETGDTGAIAAALVDFQRLPGVLAASLVYQHSESAQAMTDEVDLEDHAQGIR